MNLLQGKKALIFGVANRRSIAWGIAQAFHQQGATIGLSYAGEALARRVLPLAESLGCDFVEPCDVTNDEEIAVLVEKASRKFGQIDILVHAIAFADREDLARPYYQTSRKGFHLAMDVSVFSFVALANAFAPMLHSGSSLLTLTYYGSEKVMPNYNVMGVAKAALEASVRYMAYDFGQQGVRVNAISAGPIRTLAAAGVSGFKAMYHQFSQSAPLHQPIEALDVGQSAVFLNSELASKITGEVLYVDSGYNILGLTSPVA